MTRMKYIILSVGGLERPYVFSELDSHFEVARSLGYHPDHVHCIGAGFCYIAVDTVIGAATYKCYGESTSLRINSRGEKDSKVLNQTFGLVERDF